MELADTEVEKQGYNAFERLMFMLIPILFVIVLLGVLYAMFDSGFRNRALEFGQSIPVIKNVLPEPKATDGSLDDNQIRSTKMTEKIAELEAELAAVKQELASANGEKGAQSEAVQDLQAENALLKQQNDDKRLEDEEYAAKITELSSMFSKMTPSKAAPIVQNMTPDEIVLLFSSMRPDDRVRIMEKMDPRIAAEATMKLKDSQTAKDMQIAALQSRLEKAEKAEEKPVSATLDQEQLGATFTAMDAKSAGEMLIKMMEISPSKVLRILNSVNDTSRSAILTEMSKTDKTAAANIMSKLMSGT